MFQQKITELDIAAEKRTIFICRYYIYIIIFDLIIFYFTGFSIVYYPFKFFNLTYFISPNVVQITSWILAFFCAIVFGISYSCIEKEKNFYYDVISGKYDNVSIKMIEPEASVWGSSSLDVNIFKVLNNQKNTTTGTLRLRIWAKKTLYNNSSHGYVLATYRLDSLKPKHMINSISKIMKIKRPPNGWYYISFSLEEWGGECWYDVDYADILNGDIYLQINFYRVVYNINNTQNNNDYSSNVLSFNTDNNTDNTLQKQRCSRCNGGGRIVCPTCGGSSHISCNYCSGSGTLTSWSKGDEHCSYCNGVGHKNCSCYGATITCPSCGGAGEV